MASPAHSVVIVSSSIRMNSQHHPHLPLPMFATRLRPMSTTLLHARVMIEYPNCLKTRDASTCLFDSCLQRCRSSLLGSCQVFLCAALLGLPLFKLPVSPAL